MSNRVVLIGPDGDNECCVCGFLGDKEDSGGHSCSGVCTQPNASLYGNDTGDKPGEGDVPCFPQSCCPCPPTGASRSVELTLNAACDSGGVSETIILSAPDGIAICSGDNPYNSSLVSCYDMTEVGRSGEYEKYGKKDHVFNSITVSGTTCEGAKADISLCCCGDYGSEVRAGSTGECHTCNYVLTIQFNQLDGSWYCDCPEYPETELLPGYSAPGEDFFNGFELISSNCDPFYLEYEAKDLWWNCGPCLNGDGPEANTVDLYATITKVP